MRKLATIRRIEAINPIPGADAIEVATVGGWKVVVKKGEFEVDSMAVYLEVDSWVPQTIAPFLVKGKEPRVYEGIPGERLKTVRLRGQLSQGLLLAGIPCPSGLMVKQNESVMQHIFQEGDDVSEWLGIVKWERAMPAQLAGQVKGNFPSLIPKTDQERVQNLSKEIQAARGQRFEVTEKLEGSSMTCYLIDGEFGVCSRNLDLKRDDLNSFWAVAIRDDIEAKMRAWGDNISVQGELIGPGIQDNIYKLSKPEFRVFDIYDVKAGAYMNPGDRRLLANQLGLNHVPVLVDEFTLSHGVEQLLALAEAATVVGNNLRQQREGIVFKQVDGGMTFKAISNKYLLGER